MMKQPKTSLPWDENLEFICDGDVQDLDYILQSVNNFPKAIELLKRCQNTMDVQFWELDEFLIQIEE